MRIPVMLADYPDWMFGSRFIVAAITVPALLFVLIASAARLKQNVGVSRGLLIAAGVWVAGGVSTFKDELHAKFVQIWKVRFRCALHCFFELRMGKEKLALTVGEHSNEEKMRVGFSHVRTVAVGSDLDSCLFNYFASRKAECTKDKENGLRSRLANFHPRAHSVALPPAEMKRRSQLLSFAPQAGAANPASPMRRLNRNKFGPAKKNRRTTVLLELRTAASYQLNCIHTIALLA